MWPSNLGVLIIYIFLHYTFVGSLPWPPVVDVDLKLGALIPLDVDAEVTEVIPGCGGESAASFAGVGCWMYRSRTWWQISSRSEVSRLSTYISHHWPCPSSFRFSQSFTWWYYYIIISWYRTKLYFVSW